MGKIFLIYQQDFANFENTAPHITKLLGYVKTLPEAIKAIEDHRKARTLYKGYDGSDYPKFWYTGVIEIE